MSDEGDLWLRHDWLVEENDRLRAENEALKRETQHYKNIAFDAHEDAERYRWLREQTWDVGGLAVVADPKTAVRLGHDCPSQGRLDAAIDAGIECATHGHLLEQAGPKFPGLSVCKRCGYRDRRKSA